MKRIARVWMLVFPILLSAVCCRGGAGNETGKLPEDFSSRNDIEKVSFMMETVSPDSVARFICDVALGKIAGVSIDTITHAISYAYENYADSALVDFSQELDDYSASLPLNEKMKIYSMVGKTDPMRMGYELGLEFVGHIREKRMTVGQIEEEINAFKNACVNDSDTYHRFVKGFQTALKVDHGKDLPEEVFNRFM